MNTDDKTVVTPEELREFGIMSLETVKRHIVKYEEAAVKKMRAQADIDHGVGEIEVGAPLPTDTAKKLKNSISVQKAGVAFFVWLVINVIGIVTVSIKMLSVEQMLHIFVWSTWIIQGFVVYFSLAYDAEVDWFRWLLGVGGQVLWVGFFIWTLARAGIDTPRNKITFWSFIAAFVIPNVSYLLCTLFMIFTKKDRQKIEQAEAVDERNAKENVERPARMRAEREAQIERQKAVVRECEEKCTALAARIRMICPFMVMEQLYTKYAVEEMINYLERGKAELLTEAMELFVKTEKTRSNYRYEINSATLEQQWKNEDLLRERERESSLLAAARTRSAVADKSYENFERELERQRRENNLD